MPSGSPRPFRPQSKRAPHLYGSPPLPLPIVSTIGVRTLTATTATVVGSFNPQGLSGSMWFAYGTTPQFGSQTGTISVVAQSTPLTELVTISGLTTGVEYWVATVGQTAGGTVIASPVTFTPTVQPAVPNASQPIVPIGTPTPTIPTFAYPFQMTDSGAVVVEQGSEDEIFDNVQAIAVCPIGACPDLPTFGIPDPTFQPGPPNTNAIIAAIMQWEPRANESAMTYALDNSGGNWGITLTTRALGTGQ